jgi:hypothetical protein
MRVLQEVGGWCNEGLGGLVEPVQEGVVLGFEAPVLGIGEAGAGKREGGEVVESLADALEALLEPDGERAEGGGSIGLRTDGGERVAEDRGALALRARRSPGGDERQRLSLLELVAPSAAEQRRLGVLRDGGERVGERGAELSLVELLLGGGSKTVGEGVAAGDPGLAAPEQASDRGDGQPVVADERIDDARLVHGAEGPGRCVRAQQERLALGDGGGLLEDGGDLLHAGGAPAGQALQAVDDLEGAVVLRDDAQREVREWFRGGESRRRRAQRSKSRAEAVDRKAVENGTVRDHLLQVAQPARHRRHRLRSRAGREAGRRHSGR